MDRSVKILLGLVAAGLWANVAISALWAEALVGEIAQMNKNVWEIASDVGLLARGGCSNPKLCEPALLQSK